MTDLSTGLLPTDDSGDKLSGTPITRAFWDTWRVAINTLISSATNPTVTPVDIIDEVVLSRGSMPTLWERLAVSINPNGTLISASNENLDISVLFGATAVAGQCMYMDETDGTWLVVDTSVTADAVRGFCVANTNIGENGAIRRQGIITGLSGLTPGALYYAETFPSGGLTTTPPTDGPALIMGRAATATALVLDLAPLGTTAPYTITTTGTVASMPIPTGTGPLTVICNNATALTIYGIAEGYDGQVLRIISKGAGQVNLVHQSGSASGPANRLINFATTIDTPLAAGVGTATLVYDLTTARWRLVEHEQGEWIAYTPTWGNTGTANTLGNGTIAGLYYLKGRTAFVTIGFGFGSTSSVGSGYITFSLPIAAVSSGSSIGVGHAYDFGSGIYGLTVFRYASTSAAPMNTNAVSNGLTGTIPMTWVAGDECRLNLTYQVG